MKTWLLIDTNNLCHRAFYATGGLSYNNTPTGVLYGVFGAIMQLEGEFPKARMVFAFDKGRKSHRRTLYTPYKKRRRTKTEAEKQKYKDLYKQINILRKKYLKKIGFRNVLSKSGFEADDIIARLCQSLRRDKVIIISSDEDFYQLLTTDNVSMWNPRTKAMWTRSRFKEVYGIDPEQWVMVKAMCGCSTDEVCGIRGVGERTAIDFLRNKLSTKTKKYNSIVCKEGKSIIRRNIPLVQLPFDGTPIFRLRKDKKLNWSVVLQELGIKSLHPKEPPYKEE